MKTKHLAISAVAISLFLASCSSPHRERAIGRASVIRHQQAAPSHGGSASPLPPPPPPTRPAPRKISQNQPMLSPSAGQPQHADHAGAPCPARPRGGVLMPGQNRGLKIR